MFNGTEQCHAWNPEKIGECSDDIISSQIPTSAIPYKTKIPQLIKTQNLGFVDYRYPTLQDYLMMHVFGEFMDVGDVKGNCKQHLPQTDWITCISFT
jgi:hypothetical protein